MTATAADGPATSTTSPRRDAAWSQATPPFFATSTPAATLGKRWTARTSREPDLAEPQRGAYSYDGTGNIKAIGSETFLYDSLSRVVSAQLPGGAFQLYTFDPYGNITSTNTNGLVVNSPTTASTNRIQLLRQPAKSNAPPSMEGLDREKSASFVRRIRTESKAGRLAVLIRQLSSDELQLLRASLGRSVPELYSPYLNVCRLWYGAPHFSMHLGGGEFLVVESDWADTRKEALDYHAMHVSTADHPKGVPKSFDKETGRKMIGSPVSTVEIGPPKSEIISITVLERQKTGREEAVRYDSGLVFTRSDGRRFALGVRESIAGGLECSTDSECIDELLAEDGARLVLS